MSEAATAAQAPPLTKPAQRRPVVLLLRRSWRQTRTKVGVALVLLLVGIVLIGPLFAPHTPSEFVGAPYAHASGSALLGTDNLGRDVLSRFLWGGRSVLGLALAATALGLALGVTIGLVAAYASAMADEFLMRAMDVLLAFPSLVLALVAVATLGPQLWLLVLVVGVTTAPRVSRVTRGSSVEIVNRDFVAAAEAMGEPRRKILLSEILPNVASPLLVEASLRLTYSVGLIAALSFLGFGLQPPAADWGLMINENRQGLTVQPWGVVAPVLAIALLTIGTSLIGDGIARASAGIERGGGEEWARESIELSKERERE
jgi:peptide/nickel transport system permease protein